MRDILGTRSGGRPWRWEGPFHPLIAGAALLILLSVIYFLAQGGAFDGEGKPHLEFNRTIQVTPDVHFKTGGFARINYVPSTDRFVVTFGTKGSLVRRVCNSSGYAYKEYTTDMAETGESGYLLFYPQGCEAGDSGSTMVGDSYFLVTVPQEMGHPNSWRITKFNASSWTIDKDIYYPFQSPNESDLDPSVAFINGELDVSDQYNPNGIWQDGYESHHEFFSLDLEPRGKRILSGSPHISGMSMMYVNGVYYLLLADSYSGDLVVLSYDKNWTFLESKTLIKEASWPQGSLFDGKNFYVAYTDTSIRTEPGFFPVYPNVHVAIFDSGWDLVEDIAVTDFEVSDYKKAGRPWLMLHDDRLYVSYDVDTVDPETEEEHGIGEAYVSIYDIVRG